MESSENSFWRTSSRIVPGRPRNNPNAQTIKAANKPTTSFQNFQESVSDAWDLSLDDLIPNCHEPGISMSVSETAALNVIETHTNNTNWEQAKVDNDDYGVISGANDYSDTKITRYSKCEKKKLKFISEKKTFSVL